MEEDQEQRHLCKFCNKRFPCGRSLGGHMRSHMRNTSTKTKEKLDKKKVSSSVNGGNSNNNTYMVDFEAGGHAGYGLRENPKKTWRISNSISTTLQKGKVCKECGKGFHSWKALFGHMRCHSDREKISNSLEDDSWTGENQKLVMDSQSDTEAAAPRRRRRSRRTRYNATITAATTTTATTTTTSVSFANASTSVSEIEQEQEEVAMCLMMLSRDVGYWGGLNSVVETSDNHSVVVEVRSSSLVKRITDKEDSNGDQTVKMKKPRDKKLDSVVSNSENVRLERERSEFGGSNVGVLRNGFKKLESEVSVDGFIGEDKFKNPKLDDEAGFEVSDAELGKCSYNRNRVKCLEAELGKDLLKEAYDQADSECGKYNSSKRTRFDAGDPELGGGSSKKMRYGDSDSPKKSKYLCTTCNKIFHSYQALGGHRASHKKVRGCFASKIENSENSIETDVSPDPTNDNKLIKTSSNKSPNEREVAGNAETNYGLRKTKHECPICYKVFTSGQALGGHKRSHVVEGSEARGSQTIVIQQKLPEIHDLLDLNLPAPIEEDTNSHIRFKPWWVGSDHKHESPMGLISN